MQQQYDVGPPWDASGGRPGKRCSSDLCVGPGHQLPVWNACTSPGKKKGGPLLSVAGVAVHRRGPLPSAAPMCTCMAPEGAPQVTMCPSPPPATPA